MLYMIDLELLQEKYSQSVPFFSMACYMCYYHVFLCFCVPHLHTHLLVALDWRISIHPADGLP